MRAGAVRPEPKFCAEREIHMTKLHSYLIAKTRPVADEKNIVRHGAWRVTVLADRLFRIEKDKTGRFNDAATQTVWFRDAAPQVFTAEERAGKLTVKTPAATLVLGNNIAHSYVILDDVRHPLSNEGNLGGTARTLDCYSGATNIRNLTELKLGDGVCSRSGVAVVDDAASLCLNKDGLVRERSTDEIDLYVFAYGHDYRAAVQALYAITGAVPMLPRYAMGNWWSRYHRYSDEEYLKLMKNFEEHNIPLTIATVDMDWHYSDFVLDEKNITKDGKADEAHGCVYDPKRPHALGWTGYSWNTRLFPDYKAFLAELQKRGLHVTLNLHPRDGVRYFEDMYPEMAKAMGIDPATEAPVKFDITDPRFINAYFDVLHRPYEKDGVDFWWIDWQQGTKSKVEGLDPLWALNHYHFLDNAATHVRPLIMSRFAGFGSHRYPIGFSGDTVTNWESLSFLPYYTANSANAGFTWWGHDIGGHMLGTKDDELYVRYLQYGVFNPLNRLHCTNSRLATREPWAYEGGAAELAANAMRLRHSLIPYLYTCNYLTHATGRALCEPLYYECPENPEAYCYGNEYFFGPSFVVAPITRHSEEKGLTAVEVWLPEGTWTDFFTRDIYHVPAGGAAYRMVRPLDSIPALVREGGVVPMSRDAGNSAENPKHLFAKVYNGNGAFSLFEDKGRHEAFTDFVTEGGDGVQTVKISTRGERTVFPAHRELTLQFPNIEAHPLIYVNTPSHADRRDLVTLTVKKNGEVIPAETDLYGVAEVTIKDFDPAAAYEITVTYEKIDEYEEFCRRMFDKLQRIQETLAVRDNLSLNLKNGKAHDMETLIGAIRYSDLSPLEKQRLLETVVPV